MYEKSDMSKISETQKSILFGKNSFQSQSSTLKSYHRILQYYKSLDVVIREISCHFEKNSQDVLTNLFPA